MVERSQVRSWACSLAIHHMAARAFLYTSGSTLASAAFTPTICAVWAIRETGATRVKIDSTGIGWGLVGELVNLGSNGAHTAQIVGVNAAEASVEPDVYKNARAAMWWMARLHAQERTWDLSTMDNADQTVAQLLEPGWLLDLQGRIQVEKQEDIIERLCRSPDNADALLLAFYNPPGDAASALDWLKQAKRAA